MSDSASHQSAEASTPLQPSLAPFVAPKPSFVDKINWRLLLICAIAFIIVGYPTALWLSETLSGGIVDHGDYVTVNLKAMSSFDLDQYNGQPTDIPAKFRALEGRRVALDGQMWNDQDASDNSVKSFQLVYSIAKCCFSGPPLAQHFVDSNVKPGVTVDFYGRDSMIRVWGTLHVKFKRNSTDNKLASVYAVDVDKVEPL